MLGLGLLPIAAYRVARFQYDREVRRKTANIESGANRLLAVLNSPEIDPVDPGELFEPPAGAQPEAMDLGGPNPRWAARFAAIIAREVKCKMGLPSRTRANWLVAQELVNKALAERFVRKCDRLVFAPIATQLVFVPTRYDIIAKQFAHSEAVGRELEEMQGVQRTFWQWIGDALFGQRGPRVQPDMIERA